MLLYLLSGKMKFILYSNMKYQNLAGLFYLFSRVSWAMKFWIKLNTFRQQRAVWSDLMSRFFGRYQNIFSGKDGSAPLELVMYEYSKFRIE